MVKGLGYKDFFKNILISLLWFSGTRLPLRKSITMRWKSVGTTADVGGRRQDGGTVK